MFSRSLCVILVRRDGNNSISTKAITKKAGGHIVPFVREVPSHNCLDLALPRSSAASLASLTSDLLHQNSCRRF